MWKWRATEKCIMPPTVRNQDEELLYDVPSEITQTQLSKEVEGTGIIASVEDKKGKGIIILHNNKQPNDEKLVIFYQKKIREMSASSILKEGDIVSFRHRIASIHDDDDDCMTTAYNVKKIIHRRNERTRKRTRKNKVVRF